MSVSFVREDNFPYFPEIENSTQKGVSVHIPRVTLQRPLENTIKGCLSEVQEIIEALTGENLNLSDFLKTWNGEIYDKEKTVEELVDLLFYVLSVLAQLDERGNFVDTVIQEVVQKNLKRGYYTNRDYERDRTRGY